MWKWCSHELIKTNSISAVHACTGHENMMYLPTLTQTTDKQKNLYMLIKSGSKRSNDFYLVFTKLIHKNKEQKQKYEDMDI
jgi:hypothetical protein